MVTDTQPMADLPTELLAEIPSILADLYRETWDYKVRVIYLPDLDKPEAAHVSILDRDNKLIDTLTLATEDGFKAYKDPFAFSTALTLYMRGVESIRA